MRVSGWPRMAAILVYQLTTIGFKVYPRMLRHACGYALANKGIDTRTLQAYLGHRSINSTTRYAALAPGRFKNIWGKGVG
jgi:type 1 fimbriae regulatory protein FimB